MSMRAIVIRLAPVLAAVLAAAAAAQEPAQPADLVRAGLTPEPLRIEALGVVFHPPASAVLQLRRGDRASATLVDGSSIPTWSMTIQTAPAMREGSTAKSEIEARLESWTAAGRTWKTFASGPQPCAGREGYVWYVEYTAATEEPVISGWFLVPTDEGRFLQITMQTIPEEMPRLSRLFSAMFAAFELLDPRALRDAIEQRIETGRTVLASITPERLQGLSGRSFWLRHYLTAADAGRDLELGWFHVDFREAPRGALNPARQPANYDPAERTTGLFVEVYGRMIESREYDVLVDSEMLFWLAWDQTEESWAIRLTRRQGDRSQSEAETGIRAPRSTSSPGGNLGVISTDKSGGIKPRHWPNVPDPYLSQALGWAIGTLLPRDADEPLGLSYYFYDSSSGQLALRVDRWQPAGDGSGDWVLRSRPDSDADEVVSRYDAAGKLIRRTWPDGSISEVVPEETIQRVWGRPERRGVAPRR